MPSVYIYAPTAGSQVTPDFGVSVYASIEVVTKGGPPAPTAPLASTWELKFAASTGTVTPTSKAVTASGSYGYSVAAAAAGTCQLTADLYETPSGGTQALVATSAIDVTVGASGSGTLVRISSSAGALFDEVPEAAAVAAAKLQFVLGTYEVADKAGTPKIDSLGVAVGRVKPTYSKVAVGGGKHVTIGSPLGRDGSEASDPMTQTGTWIAFLNPAGMYTVGGGKDKSPYVVEVTAYAADQSVLSVTSALLGDVLWVATNPN
jgi:hypothetical protein